MKKILTCFVAVAMMAAAGLTSSCSKNQIGATNSSVTVSAAYRFETTTDFLKYFDQKLEYYDFISGQIKSIMLTNTTFSLEASPKLPLTVGMRLTTTLKDGVTLDQIEALKSFQYISPSLDYGVFINYNNSNAEKTFGKITIGATPMSLTGAKIVEGYNAGRFSKSFMKKFDADGNVSDGSWE